MALACALWSLLSGSLDRVAARSSIAGTVRPNKVKHRFWRRDDVLILTETKPVRIYWPRSVSKTDLTRARPRRAASGLVLRRRWSRTI